MSGAGPPSLGVLHPATSLSKSTSELEESDKVVLKDEQRRAYGRVAAAAALESQSCKDDEEQEDEDYHLLCLFPTSRSAPRLARSTLFSSAE